MCRDATRAVDEPEIWIQQVERAGDLLADRPQPQIDATGRERASRGGKARRATSWRGSSVSEPSLARVHRLKHVERLGAATSPTDDAVGPRMRRAFRTELADPNLGPDLDVRPGATRARSRVPAEAGSSAASSIVTMRSSPGRMPTVRSGRVYRCRYRPK